MMQINLLPWREQARKLNKIRFFVWLGCFVGLAFILLVIFHIRYSLTFSDRQELNDYIKNEINLEQNFLANLTQQQNIIHSLEAQLHFIIDLQKQNFRAIVLMNELTKVVPRNVSLNKVMRNGNKITIIGVGKTNTDLTAFKDAIAKSRFFSQTTLTEISSEKNESAIHFTLDIEQKDLL